MFAKFLFWPFWRNFFDFFQQLCSFEHFFLYYTKVSFLGVFLICGRLVFFHFQITSCKFCKCVLSRDIQSISYQLLSSNFLKWKIFLRTLSCYPLIFPVSSVLPTLCTKWALKLILSPDQVCRLISHETFICFHRFLNQIRS